MFLRGIIAEGTSDAFEVLNDLEITMKDARLVVEKLVGYGNEYFEKEIGCSVYDVLPDVGKTSLLTPKPWKPANQ